MKSAEDATFKIVCDVSWLNWDNKEAYLAGVRTVIKVARELVRADEIYVSRMIWRAIMSADEGTRIRSLIEKMNDFTVEVEFSTDFFGDLVFLGNTYYRRALERVAGDIVDYYDNLAGGNFSQAKRQDYFFEYLDRVEELLQKL